MSKLPDRYWDSSAFIAYFKEEAGRVDLCQAVIDAAQRGQTRIITSALTLSEVVHIKGYEKLTPDLESDLEAFFEHDFIVLVDLTALHGRNEAAARIEKRPFSQGMDSLAAHFEGVAL